MRVADGLRRGVIGRRSGATRQFLSRLATPASSVRQQHYSDFISALVACGAWAVADVVTAFVPGDQAASLTNLVQSSYSGTNSGNGTTTGAIQAAAGYFSGNGVDAEIDTGFNPTTATSPNFTQDNGTIVVFALTPGQDAGGIFGVATGTPKNEIYTRYIDDKAYYRVNIGTSSSVDVLSGVGVLAAGRSGSTATSLHRKGRLATTQATSSATSSASSAADNGTFRLFRDRTNFSTGKLAGYAIFGDLTDAQKQAVSDAYYRFALAEGVITAAEAAHLVLLGSVTHATDLLAPEDVKVIPGTTKALVPLRDGGAVATVDFSTPTPTIPGVFTDPDLTKAMGVALNPAATRAYVTDWHGRHLLTLNCTTPASLTKVSSIQLGAVDPGADPDELRKVIYHPDGYAICAQNYEGKAYIVDVTTNEAAPTVVGTASTGAKLFCLALSDDGRYLFGGDFYGTSIYVWDILNKAAPVLVKTLTAAGYDGISCMRVTQGLLIATFYNNTKLGIFDASSPANLSQISLSSIAPLTHPNRFIEDGNYLYVAAAGADMVGTIDFADRTSPTVVATLTGTPLGGAYGIDRHGTDLLLCARTANRVGRFVA